MIKIVRRRSSHAAFALAVVITAMAAFAAPVAAQVADPRPAVRNYTLTPRRMAASGASVIAAIGAVMGGLALARSAGGTGAGTGRRGAIVALVMGPLGLMMGGLVVATAEGGLGTGNGIAGGVVAMVVGSISIALGGLALARSSRVA